MGCKAAGRPGYATPGSTAATRKPKCPAPARARRSDGKARCRTLSRTARASPGRRSAACTPPSRSASSGAVSGPGLPRSRTAPAECDRPSGRHADRSSHDSSAPVPHPVRRRRGSRARAPSGPRQRLLERRDDDRRLPVVRGHLLRHAAEPLEGVDVAGEEGLLLLIEDHLAIGPVTVPQPA